MIKNLLGKVGVFVLSMTISGGVGCSKKIHPKGYPIPNISKGTLINTRASDLTDKIKGKETLVENYSLKNPKRIISRVSIRGNTFLYGIGNRETEEYFAIADMDGDGIFETKYKEKDLTYSSKGEFPAKKELPPEWVTNK